MISKLNDQIHFFQEIIFIQSFYKENIIEDEIVNKKIIQINQKNINIIYLNLYKNETQIKGINKHIFFYLRKFNR